MKYYEFVLNYETVKQGIRVDTTRNAVLKSGDSDFTLKDIHSFISDIKKIYKDAARLAKKDGGSNPAHLAIIPPNQSQVKQGGAQHEKVLYCNL